MCRWKVLLLGSVLVVGGMFAVATAADAAAAPSGTPNPKPAPAVTCEPKLKHGDPICSAGEPQYHFIRFAGNDRQDYELARFRKAVKKEPKYASEQPIRAVAMLGGKLYAFAIDKKDGKSKAYSRLYFDANGNGDLTDDTPIDVKASSTSAAGAGDYVSSEFPQVKVLLDIGGVKVDYAFSLHVTARLRGNDSYAQLSLAATTCREGLIELEGKKHRLVLLDYNSNGKFDDKMEVEEVQRYGDEPSGRVSSTGGDLLLVDPDPKALPADRTRYGAEMGDQRQPLSKLVRIDGRYYEVQVSPAGDKLTLTASSIPLGCVTSPHQGLSAVFYGEQGCVAVECGKSGPVPLPSGRWKLLSYTIDQTESYRAILAKEEEARLSVKKPGSQASTDQLLGGLLESLVGVEESRRLKAEQGRRSTIVSAEAAGNCPAVSVGKGETVKLPFGPPFQPVVTAYRVETEAEAVVVGPDGKVQPQAPAASPNKEAVARVSMSLVGAAGEVCTDLTVNGEMPPAPKFTIKTPDGKVVQSGDFEYG